MPQPFGGLTGNGGLAANGRTQSAEETAFSGLNGTPVETDDCRASVACLAQEGSKQRGLTDTRNPMDPGNPGATLLQQL
jgi:hypothetical protein